MTNRINEFPRFWFDGNQAMMWVNDLEDLQQVFKQYEGIMTPDEVLDKALNANEELTNFGLYYEHNGDVTLREFLTDNEVVL